MKRIIVLLCFITFSILNAEDIDEIVTKINSSRGTTIPKEKLTNIVSPMPKLVVVDQNSTDTNNTVAKPKEESFILTAIMNSSAHINGKWVKIGERVGTYKLIDIMDDSVYLKDGNKTKLIFFKQTSGKIKIKIGR